MAEKTKRVTATTKFEDLKELAMEAERLDLVEFCDAQIAQRAKKAAKAAEKRANTVVEKEPDTLLPRVLDALTSEPSTKEEILARVIPSDTDKKPLTVAMVVNRLSTLVREGKAVKELQIIVVDESTNAEKPVNCYRLA